MENNLIIEEVQNAIYSLRNQSNLTKGLIFSVEVANFMVKRGFYSKKHPLEIANRRKFHDFG